MVQLDATQHEFGDVYNRNIDTVYRVCYLYLKNKSDAEDMTQNTFMRYLRYNPTFDSVSHEKAWFIVTATNLCKNHFKTWWYKNTKSKDDLEHPVRDSKDEIIELVLGLPDKYKIVIYLYYYEGYSTNEISTLLNINESTIRTNLSKGRKALKNMIGA
jgi:RNA polymerase sigma-70 factor (ECF subfamily)